MPIYCESITKFWGEGTNQIYEWAQDGDEGVFFARVFGHDYENASDDDWDLWEDEYISYRLCNMGCQALKNEDGSINLAMSTIRLIPTGVFEKIAELFPNIHADGRFIQQTEEFFGNIVIENGTFLWTNFHNPGIRSKNDDFRFTDFFADRYKDVEDKEQLEVLC